MARLHTRSEDTLSTESLKCLEPTRVSGKLADVYLQFANSEHALSAYLGMEASLKQSVLSDRELEAIKLQVSEITGCHYCLSVHTMKATKAGIDKNQQAAIRMGHSIGDDKLDTILAIVRHFFNHRSPVPDELLTNARLHQISDTTLVDIAMAVSTIFFTNITNHINDTDLTLPSAPSLS